MVEKKEKQEETQSEFKIEDLPGVGPSSAEKLRENGFDDLMTIAVSSPSEVSNITGLTENAARKIIKVARTKLDMGFESGADLLRRRERVIKITTGIFFSPCVRKNLTERDITMAKEAIQI